MLGHRGGARHIPVGELSQRLAELDDFNNHELMTEAGPGAAPTRRLMKQAGFDHVFAFGVGTNAWSEAGLAVEESRSLRQRRQ